MSAINKVTVIGAGLMGHGIAQVFAVHHHAVTIFDTNPKVLESVRSRIQTNLHDLGENPSALDRLNVCPVLEQAVAGADFVVEAAPENLALKRKLFETIEAAAPAAAILASNTLSSRSRKSWRGLRTEHDAWEPTGGTRRSSSRWLK